MSVQNSNSPSLVPTFQHVRRLGSGTYGEVDLVESGGRFYARKNVSLLEVDTTMMEISLYTLLSHPNIMETFYYIPSSDNRTISIIMDQADSTLESRFFRPGAPASEAEVRLIIHQILSGVEYLHANNIIHADLKSANILMDNMFVRIIDLGLAQLVRPGYVLNQNIQTITYRAPEVQKQEPYSFSADIWSVGIIMISLILGRHYYPYRSDRDMENRLLNQHPQLMASINTLAISNQGKALLRRLVAFDPNMRASAREALRDPWFEGMPYNGPEIAPLRRVQYDFVDPTIEPEIFSFVRKYNISNEAYNYGLKMLKFMMDNNPGVNTMQYFYVTIYLAGVMLGEIPSSSMYQTYTGAVPANTSDPAYQQELRRISNDNSVVRKQLVDVLRMMKWNVILA